MTDNLHYALDGTWRVLLASLVFGAGLPIVYAFGIRALAWGAGGDAEVSHAGPHRAGRLLAGGCFAVVLCGVALGLCIIAGTGFGKQVSFEQGYPTFVTKES